MVQPVPDGLEGRIVPYLLVDGAAAAMATDPFGHFWSLHPHIRDVSTEEMAAAMQPKGGDS